MWKSTMWRTAALLALAMLAWPARDVFGQNEPSADFKTVRDQFVAGQLRPAANTLLRSTLYIRQQVGRSKDEVVGMQLLTIESELEQLALTLRSGREVSLRALETELQRADRLLAQHYVQMATAALAHPRADDLPILVKDMGRSAFHYERVFTLTGRAVGAEVTTLLTEVRTLAADIERLHAIPKSAAATLALFEKQITGATVVAVSLR